MAANFPAEITLTLKTEGVLRKIKQVETALGNALAGDKKTAKLEKKLAKLEAKQVRINNQRKAANIQELNDTSKLIRLFKQAAQVRASYAKDAERAAKSAEREAAAVQKTAARNKQSRGRAIGSAASGAIISAAFPILTGGGAAESALGGIGGLIGSALGPLGSFAGGIGGSALGRIIQDAEDLNKQLTALNAKFGDTGAAALITAGDVSELAKQLNITKEDVVSLGGELAAFAQLSAIEDLAKAFGPVGGAGTFDALAQAAEDEAAALKAIDGLRGQIGLKTAEELLKVLEIEGSEAAQAALLDALLNKTTAITDEVAKQVTFWDRIAAAIFTAASGEYIAPEDLAGERADGIVGPDKSVISTALADYEKYLQTRRSLDEKYNPKATKQGRSAAPPQSKELQLRQQILKTELSLSEIERKRSALQLTDLGATRAKQLALQESLPKQIQILELQRQQALTTSKVPEDNILINQLYDERLNKIVAENSLLLEQNRIREQQIILQRDLVALRNEQQTGGIVEGLERGIEDANSRSSSEMLSLRIKQLRRQEDLIGDINDKLEIQKRIEASGDAEKSEAATREIGFLEDRKAAIEALLPALNQAEQQQLRFNQAFAAVTPAVNSLVGGLREVIAGTKTAEEAFADFLTTIADQLINTAAEMIAQYIAIGLAKAFAGLGSNSMSAVNGTNYFNPITGLGNAGPNYGLAEGGYVTGPTKALVGEGGEPEYVIPESKMTGAMNRWNGGTRGGNVVSGADSGSGGEGSGFMSSAPTNVIINGGVTQMGNTDYIRKDEIPSIVAQASKQGEAMTLRRLQMSPGTRRKLGM